jgi:carbonic anhydrase/acetyltransferase-like protein (isoleucine patch superfamily)
MNQIKHPSATIRSYRDLHPQIHESVVVLDGVRIIGDVTIGSGSSVWYNAVIRGDVHTVAIGVDTNIQDNSVLHVTHDRFSLTIGDRVTVGHAARIHGCVVEDETLIGIGAIVLDGAIIKRHAMVAAGAVVTPGTIVESGVLVAGVPAKPIRSLTDREIEDLPRSAERYRNYALQHAQTVV